MNLHNFEWKPTNNGHSIFIQNENSKPKANASFICMLSGRKNNRIQKKVNEIVQSSVMQLYYSIDGEEENGAHSILQFY